MAPPDDVSQEPAHQAAAPAMPESSAAPQHSSQQPTTTNKTLLFANDKSSGKTTSANAVLVSLLDRYPLLMRSVHVREYDRQPRLANIFRKEDGFASMTHYDARNAHAFDVSRQIAHDPNATAWDDLLFALGGGAMVVDLGANIFAEICRILDEEPRPIFPEGGAAMGVCVPVTTATDSIESAIMAIEAALNWGPRVQVFAIQQEYLGRFEGVVPEWTEFLDRTLAAEGSRVQAIRIEKLAVADIGRVVFQRIDQLVSNAQEMLRSTDLQGADYIRAVRKARSEVAWGAKTMDAVRPIADWFAH